MTGWIKFLILIVLADINHAKEEKKTTFIIAVDEARPEESEVIISDLTIKDRRPYETEVRAATDKQLDYIIVRPEDLKALKGLDDVSVENPKIVRYPESGSDESDDVGRYSPYSEKSYLINAGYPDSPQEVSRSRVVKYPSRPAPPLVTYSGGNSNADTISLNSPNPQSGYGSYNSPSSAPYSGAVPNDAPHVLPVNNDQSYSSLKPSGYSNPSSYSDPNTYPEISSYSVPGGNYGSKSNSYSSPSPNYREPSKDSYSDSNPYSGNRNPSTYSGPSSYSETPSYGASKPSSYSGTTDYESLKPSDNFSPSSYENSRPISYSDPDGEYSNRKPSSYSSYSDSPYSASKSSSHSNSNPHYDTSAENGHSESGKYIRSPETIEKAYSYDGHHSPKSIPSSQEYDPDTRYTPENKHYKSKYHDSSPISIQPVKHVSYDDLPSSYKSSREIEYDPPQSAFNSDSLRNSPNTYNKPSKSSRGTIYRNALPKKGYYSPTAYYKDENHNLYGPSTKPLYGKKLRISSSSPGYKPRSVYNSKAGAGEDYGSPAPISTHTGKKSYDSLKTSYETPYEPSSYEEPLKPNSYSHPSHNGASKETYDSPVSYNNDQYYRPSVSNLKENSGRSPYDDSPYSKSKPVREHSSSYHTPHSKNEEFGYESRPPIPSKYENSAYNDQEILTSKYKNPEAYKSHSSSEYGSRYPTYQQQRQSDLNSPATSYFTAEDGRSPDDIPNYKEKKSSGGSPDSHSHHYEDDSSYVPENHSVKKNYSPVRPAPLHDQLEQPRHPPLPRIPKSKKDKRYSSEEAYSNEKDDDYKPELSYSKIKSYKPESYNPGYDTELHRPPYSSTKAESSRYPSSAESNKHPYSSHSSEESGEEPQVYTKTITTTYTKPNKDSSNEHAYSLENSDKNAYDSPVEYLRRNRYDSKGKNVASHAEYPGLIYKESVKQSDHPQSYSPTRERKYPSNTSLPVSYSSLSEILPPKRVEGIVYRSRQSYPHVKGYRKQKGFLPYKPFYTKSALTVDHKPYEGVPSEIRENNVTKDLSVYEIPERTRSKSTNYPHSKREKYSSRDSHSGVTSDDSSHAAIPGEPGKDYPVLRETPYNRFTCENKIPGFYADVENRCQAYYQCSDEGRMQSFLCPNGTIFNQQTFVCEWWYNVDCSKSEKHFGKNSLLYKIPQQSVGDKSKRTARNSYRHSEPDISSSQEYPLYHTEETESQPQSRGRIRSN